MTAKTQILVWFVMLVFLGISRAETIISFTVLVILNLWMMTDAIIETIEKNRKEKNDV